MEQDLYKKILDEINAEVNIDKHIEEMSSEIAANLTLSKSCEVEINGTPYRFSYTRGADKKGKDTLMMIVANRIKYEIAAGKYVPFTVSAEMNTAYSLNENLVMLAEAFVRKITNQVRVDNMDDE